MKITTVYFDRPCGDLHYTKCMIPEEAVDFFIEMGALREQPQESFIVDPPAPPEEEDVEAYVDDGDKGAGKPGSKEWRIAEIKQAKYKKEIVENIMQAYDIDILEGEELNKIKVVELKEKAIKIIEEKHGNG